MYNPLASHHVSSSPDKAPVTATASPGSHPGGSLFLLLLQSPAHFGLKEPFLSHLSTDLVAHSLGAWTTAFMPEKSHHFLSSSIPDTAPTASQLLLHSSSMFPSSHSRTARSSLGLCTSGLTAMQHLTIWPQSPCRALLLLDSASSVLAILLQRWLPVSIRGSSTFLFLSPSFPLSFIMQSALKPITLDLTLPLNSRFCFRLARQSSHDIPWWARIQARDFHWNPFP